VWRGIFSLTFPFFLLSAGLAALMAAATPHTGWYALGTLPAMYGVYRSYQIYWSALESSGGDRIIDTGLQSSRVMESAPLQQQYCNLF
jgi:hypothetical protein